MIPLAFDKNFKKNGKLSPEIKVQKMNQPENLVEPDLTKVITEVMSLIPEHFFYRHTIFSVALLEVKSVPGSYGEEKIIKIIL